MCPGHHSIYDDCVECGNGERMPPSYEDGIAYGERLGHPVITPDPAIGLIEEINRRFGPVTINSNFSGGWLVRLDCENLEISSGDLTAALSKLIENAAIKRQCFPY